MLDINHESAVKTMFGITHKKERYGDIKMPITAIKFNANTKPIIGTIIKLNNTAKADT